ncbi:MAG: drug/metabolite transporter (DMT)-like permease [Polaribacter sp.]|jgi:drug/metabolite transporter (DMT)-like permease
MSKTLYLSYALIIVAGAIWGGVFSLVLLAASEGAHPLGIAVWQVVITAALFVAYRIITKKPIIRRVNLVHYAVLAVVGISFPSLSYYYAASHLTAGILSISVSAIPLFSYMIMLALKRERFVTRRVFGIVFGMIAILLLVIPDQGLSSDDASLWIILAVVCAFSYAVEGVYIDHKVDPQIDVSDLLCGSNILAALVMVPVGLWLGVSEPVTWLMTPAGYGVIGASIGTGLAYALYFYAIKIAGAVFTSQCAYIITISGVFLGIIFYGEQHSIWIWIAVAISLVGLSLVRPVSHVH